MIQLKLALTDLPTFAQTIWEQLAPAHREALTRRLAGVVAKAATPAVDEGASDDE